MKQGSADCVENVQNLVERKPQNNVLPLVGGSVHVSRTQSENIDGRGNGTSSGLLKAHDISVWINAM